MIRDVLIMHEWDGIPMAKRRRTPLDRSGIMSRIRGTDTLPELTFRRALRGRGIGYRLHAKDLPGRPDVVFRGHRLAVFVHGCFWHRHPGCRHASSPKSSQAFWNAKFSANVARDRRSIAALHARGWRVGVVWECEIGDSLLLSLAVDAIAEAIGRTKLQDAHFPIDAANPHRHKHGMKNVSTSSSTSSTTL